jgi:hypothetical protein
MLSPFATCLFFVFPLIADVPALPKADGAAPAICSPCYVVHLRLVETTADGKPKVLSAPTLVVPEGQHATMFVGGEVELPGIAPDKPQKARVGTRVRTLVFRDQQADTMLDLEVEVGEQLNAPENRGEIQVHRRVIRTVVAVTPEKPRFLNVGGFVGKEGQLRVEVKVVPANPETNRMMDDLLGCEPEERVQTNESPRPSSLP